MQPTPALIISVYRTVLYLCMRYWCEDSQRCCGLWQAPVFSGKHHNLIWLQRHRVSRKATIACTCTPTNHAKVHCWARAADKVHSQSAIACSIQQLPTCIFLRSALSSYSSRTLTKDAATILLKAAVIRFAAYLMRLLSRLQLVIG